MAPACFKQDSLNTFNSNSCFLHFTFDLLLHITSYLVLHVWGYIPPCDLYFTEVKSWDEFVHFSVSSWFGQFIKINHVRFSSGIFKVLGEVLMKKCQKDSSNFIGEFMIFGANCSTMERTAFQSPDNLDAVPKLNQNLRAEFL